MLPASSAVAILTAKFFADLERMKDGFDWPGLKGPAILTGIIFFVAGLFSAVTMYVLDLFYFIPLRVFVLPVVFFMGGFAVLGLRKIMQGRKHIFTISFALVLAFSFLSVDVLSYINRYPMKLFSERILKEKFSGPIAVYRLGNQKARLGVLTGQKVIKIYVPGQLAEFLKTDKDVLIVMKEEDYRNNFSGISLKIVMEDLVWLEGHIDWDKMKELLGKAESGDFSSLTEKIYLLSNN